VDSRELESAVIAQKAVHLSQQFTQSLRMQSHKRNLFTSLVGPGVGAGVGGFVGAGVGCASDIRTDDQGKGFNKRS